MKEIKYLSIYKDLKNDIESNVYKNGKLIPTEKELGVKYTVSRIVVRMAVDKLVKFGYVQRKAGYGTIVTYCKSNEKGNKTIGVLFSSLASSFGAGILLAIENEARKNGYNLIFKNSNNSQATEQACLESLLNANVEGVIMQPIHNETYCETLTNFVKRKIPVVLIDRDLPEMNFSFVGTDSILETKNAVQRLFRKGLRRICIVSQDVTKTTTLQERVEGVKLAHKESFVTPLKDNIFSDIKSISDNSNENHKMDKQRVKEFLLKNDCNCVLAFELGVAVLVSEIISEPNSPLKDLVLVTYDRGETSLLHCKYYIVQNQHNMGIQAFNMLLDQIYSAPKCIKKFLSTDFSD